MSNVNTTESSLLAVTGESNTVVFTNLQKPHSFVNKHAHHGHVAP